MTGLPAQSFHTAPEARAAATAPGMEVSRLPSRQSRLRGWLALGACLTALVPPGLAASQTRPAEAQDPRPASGPVMTRPAPVSTGQAPLGVIGPWGAAASSPAFPALPATLWRGSDPESLRILLARASPDQRAPVMAQLVRRALLSGGEAPGAGDGAMVARFDAAARFGPARDAARLWDAVPRLLDRPDLAVRAVDAWFQAGELERGCGIVRDIRVSEANPILLEQAAVCYALQRETSAAQIAIDLARSERQATPAGLQFTADADWMEQMVVAMSANGAVRLPPLRHDTPRAFGLSLAAGANPATSQLSTASGPVLGTLALRPGPAQRAAASAAAGMSALTPADWRAILPAPAPQPVAPPPPPPPPPIVDPVTGAVTTPPPPPPVAPPVQGQALTTELRGATTAMARAAVARRLAPVFADVQNPAAADRALLVEAALWAGDLPAAARFAALIPDGSDPRLALAARLLTPEPPSGRGSPTAQADAFLVQRVVERASNAAARNRAARLAAVAWAAGLPVSGAASSLIAEAPTSIGVRAMTLAGLQLAAARGAQGEAVLLAAEAMQGKELAALDPATLVLVIASLRRVGLESEARQLAAEVVLADLLPLPPPSPAATSPAPPAAAPAASPAARGAQPRATPPSGAPARAPSAGSTPARPATTPRPATTARPAATSPPPATRRPAPPPPAKAAPKAGPRATPARTNR
ncbi:MAG: hypothetical protein MUF14_07920 [Hyphomonadaceae bacterium]|nr:hypothetical protein [Hyphomonadaceae bacterium]